MGTGCRSSCAEAWAWLGMRGAAPGKLRRPCQGAASTGRRAHATDAAGPGVRSPPVKTSGAAFSRRAFLRLAPEGIPLKRELNLFWKSTGLHVRSRATPREASRALRPSGTSFHGDHANLTSTERLRALSYSRLITNGRACPILSSTVMQPSCGEEPVRGFSGEGCAAAKQEGAPLGMCPYLIPQSRPPDSLLRRPPFLTGGKTVRRVASSGRGGPHGVPARRRTSTLAPIPSSLHPCHHRPRSAKRAGAAAPALVTTLAACAATLSWARAVS